jgi:hypothetical protein
MQAERVPEESPDLRRLAENTGELFDSLSGFGYTARRLATKLFGMMESFVPNDFQIAFWKFNLMHPCTSNTEKSNRRTLDYVPIGPFKKSPILIRKLEQYPTPDMLA